MRKKGTPYVASSDILDFADNDYDRRSAGSTRFMRVRTYCPSVPAAQTPSWAAFKGVVSSDAPRSSTSISVIQLMGFVAQESRYRMFVMPEVRLPRKSDSKHLCMMLVLS